MPLQGRHDLIFFTHPAEERLDLGGYVRLAAEGPELSRADAECGLLLLDGSWRRAGIMSKAYEHVPPRSLHGFKTAYPRVSKQGTDPDNGLASVEALFLAYHVLGRSTKGLLDHYRWAEDFLRLNDLVSERRALVVPPLGGLLWKADNQLNSRHFLSNRHREQAARLRTGLK